ncbi:MAG: hypothetical protein SPL15_01005 [Lachnospiraceae bacterium]|nr:hypothetical protein [Lachnospiraceae bacterium]MDY5741567.1 hypothetical protein [Lachnospiraceae bacterium]
MSIILEIREKLKRIFSGYEYWIVAVIKAVVALIALIFINRNLGQFTLAKNPLVVIVLILISAVLPLNGIVILLGIVVLMHLQAISFMMLGVGLLLLLCGLALVFRFEKSDAWGVLFAPLALQMNVGPAIPLFFGLRGTPFSVVGIAYGTVLYYFMLMVRDRAAKLNGSSLQASADQMSAFATAFAQNKEMILMVAIFVIVLFVVYLISRSPIDYAWNIATGVGLGLYLVLYFMGASFLKIEPKIIVIPAVLVSAAMAVILQLFVFNLDYTRVEHVTFEDDDYMYYVKAVPKNSISERKMKINRINVRSGAGKTGEGES